MSEPYVTPNGSTLPACYGRYLSDRVPSDPKAQAETYLEPYLPYFDCPDLRTFNSNLAFLTLARDYIVENYDRLSESEELNILYPAGGSHLAPLEIALETLETTNVRQVNFTYTEIDSESLLLLEAYINTLVEAGLFELQDNQTIHYRPLGRGRNRVNRSETMFSLSYVTESGEEKEITIRFALNMSGERYYSQRDFNASDIVINHDPSQHYFDTVQDFLFSQYRYEQSSRAGRLRERTLFFEGRDFANGINGDPPLIYCWAEEMEPLARVFTLDEEYGCRQDRDIELGYISFILNGAVYSNHLGPAVNAAYLASSLTLRGLLTNDFWFEADLTADLGLANTSDCPNQDYDATLGRAIRRHQDEDEEPVVNREDQIRRWFLSGIRTYERAVALKLEGNRELSSEYFLMAVPYFRKIISNEPINADFFEFAWMRLGQSYFALGEPEAALDCSKKLLLISSDPISNIPNPPMIASAQWLSARARQEIDRRESLTASRVAMPHLSQNLKNWLQFLIDF